MLPKGEISNLSGGIGELLLLNQWISMRVLTPAKVVVLFVSIVSRIDAATITNTLDSVPSQLQCNQTWTNQNIIFRFTETVASEDGSDGFCSFGINAGFIWLYPSRIQLDFTQLPEAVTKIEADIDDDCGSDCTKLFAYNFGTQIAAIGNVTTLPQTLALEFSVIHPNSCAIRSFEGKVDEIRISIADAPPRITIEKRVASEAITWPTNAGSYSLERSSSPGESAQWTTETNNISIEGNNFVYQASTLTAPQFFRLRHN